VVVVNWKKLEKNPSNLFFFDLHTTQRIHTDSVVFFYWKKKKIISMSVIKHVLTKIELTLGEVRDNLGLLKLLNGVQQLGQVAPDTEIRQ